jgi:hypothetical protein
VIWVVDTEAPHGPAPERENPTQRTDTASVKFTVEFGRLRMRAETSASPYSPGGRAIALLMTSAAGTLLCTTLLIGLLALGGPGWLLLAIAAPNISLTALAGRHLLTVGRAEFHDRDSDD